MKATFAARATLHTLALWVLLLSGLGLVLGWVVDQSLREDFDRALVTMARLECASASDEPDGGLHVHERLAPPDSAHAGYRETARILDQNGSVVVGYGLLPEPDLGLLSDAVEGHIQFQDVHGKGGRFRTVYYPFEHQGQTYVMQAGVAIERLEDNLRRYRQTVGLTLLLGAGLAVILSRLLALTLTSPLHRIVQRLEAIAGDRRLSERIEGDYPDRELDALKEKTNFLLANLEELIADKQELLERKRHLLADASHELRTPLHNLQGAIEVTLRKPRSQEEYEKTLNTCLGEVQRLTHLSQQLLTLERIGSQESEKKAIDLLELAQERVEIYRSRAESLGVTLEVGGEPAAVIGDREQLGQVVDNLIANALEHGPAQCPVEIRVNLTNQGVSLSVRDQGDGIPEELRERVFDRFFRADTSRQRKTGGAGLGLAIARTIAEAHDGLLEVEDQGRPGTCFRLLLPAQSTL